MTHIVSLQQFSQFGLNKVQFFDSSIHILVQLLNEVTLLIELVIDLFALLLQTLGYFVDFIKMLLLFFFLLLFKCLHFLTIYLWLGNCKNINWWWNIQSIKGGFVRIGWNFWGQVIKRKDLLPLRRNFWSLPIYFSRTCPFRLPSNDRSMPTFRGYPCTLRLYGPCLTIR